VRAFQSAALPERPLARSRPAVQFLLKQFLLKHERQMATTRLQNVAL
jgi:hypothetical protein